MSVEMTNPAGAQYIDFGSPAATRSLTSKTMMFWFRPDVVNIDQSLFSIYGNGASDENSAILVYSARGAKPEFTSTWTTGASWYTTADQLAAATWAHIAVTYDGSSTSNDPIIYINGVSVAITEASAPTGTRDTGTDFNLAISDPDAAGFAADGKFADARIYSTILSAADILAIYNAGAFSAAYDTNLVFHAPLTNAKNLGGADFNGYTLTSSTTLVDRIACAVGTPSGSPLGSSSNP